MRAAMEAAEEERKKREKAAIAAHKKLMRERRIAFEKRFKHVWTTGGTSCNMFHYSVAEGAASEALLATLFESTAIADVE